MAKLDPARAREKINEYLKEIEKLQGLNKQTGTELKSELSDKIRALINVAFDDFKDKLKKFTDYDPRYLFGSNPNWEQEYHDSLNVMKRQLKGYDEELSLLLESGKKDKKLSEIEDAIKEKKLEAQRRKAVVETKVAGAEIELITLLRDELKRKNEPSKELSEVKKELSGLKELVEKLLQEKITMKSGSTYQEDQWYEKVIEYFTKSSLNGKEDVIRHVKNLYSNIKVCRNQLDNLHKELITTPSPRQEYIIRTQIRQVQGSLDKEMFNLAAYWNQCS